MVRSSRAHIKPISVFPGPRRTRTPRPDHREKRSIWWRGRITPRLRRSALRAAAPRATFFGAFAPPSNLFRFSSSPNTARARFHLVEGGGFEPPKAEPSDLQSDPFDRSGTPPKKRPYSLVSRGLCQPSFAVLAISMRKKTSFGVVGSRTSLVCGKSDGGFAATVSTGWTL